MLQLAGLYGKGLIVLLLQLAKLFADDLFIPYKGMIHARAVLMADVLALLIHADGIDDAPEQAKQLIQRQDVGIIHHAHGFGMVGVFVAHLLVGGIVRIAVGKAHFGFQHAGNVGKVLFRAPVAAARQIDGAAALLRIQPVDMRAQTDLHGHARNAHARVFQLAQIIAAVAQVDVRIGMAFQIAALRDVLHLCRMADDAADALEIRTVFNHIRPADAENLMNGRRLVQAVEHGERKVFGIDGMDQVFTAAHQLKRLVRAHVIQQIRLAHVFRVAAQPRTRAEHMAVAENGPVQLFAFFGQKNQLHAALLRAVAVILHINAVLGLRNLLVQRMIDRVGGDHHQPLHKGRQHIQIDACIVRVIAQTVESSIPLRVCTFQRGAQSGNIAAVGDQSMHALVQLALSAGDSPDLVSGLHGRAGDVPADESASADDQQFHAIILHYGVFCRLCTHER